VGKISAEESSESKQETSESRQETVSEAEQKDVLQLTSPEAPAAHPSSCSIDIEELDGSFRACCTAVVDQPEARSAPRVGPWRKSPEEAREDGEIMAAAQEGADATVPNGLAAELEAAFPALRRLRRLSNNVKEEVEEAESEEEDQEDGDNIGNEDDEDTEEENAEEVALSAEFIKAHRKNLRRKRRQARQLERKLRFELGDIGEIRDEVERMVLLGTATMSSEDQKRWQQMIDATFAKPIVSARAAQASAGSSIVGTNSVAPLGHAQTSPVEPPRAQPAATKLLFGGHRAQEDDGGHFYALPGAKRRRPMSSFLKKSGAAPSYMEADVPDFEDQKLPNDRDLGQSFLAF